MKGWIDETYADFRMFDAASRHLVLYSEHHAHREQVDGHAYVPPFDNTPKGVVREVRGRSARRCGWQVTSDIRGKTVNMQRGAHQNEKPVLPVRIFFVSWYIIPYIPWLCFVPYLQKIYKHKCGFTVPIAGLPARWVAADMPLPACRPE